MHEIEIILDILLPVITQPSVDPTQRLLYDVLVDIADDIDVNK